MKREVGTLILGDLQAALDAWDAPPTESRYETVESGASISVRLPNGTWLRCPEVERAS